MKKIFTIIFVIQFFLILNCFAQESTKGDFKKFRLGLKGSPTLAWLKPDVNLTNSSTALSLGMDKYKYAGMNFGLSYGIMAEFGIGKNYAFATGLDVTYTGGKLQYPTMQIWDVTSQKSILTRKYTIKYLELPLMLKMKTNEIGYLTYYGQFGFGMGFNLKATANDDYTTLLNSNHLTANDVDIKKDISFMRVSMIIGLGIEYSLSGSTALTAGINFNNGFSDVLSGYSKLANNDLSAIKEKAISNYLELNIGIIF